MLSIIDRSLDQKRPLLHRKPHGCSISLIALIKCQRTLPTSQLLGISQRTVVVAIGDSIEKCSRKKLIPANAKTLGDHLLLRRSEANMLQPELAAKTGLTVCGG